MSLKPCKTINVDNVQARYMLFTDMRSGDTRDTDGSIGIGRYVVSAAKLDCIERGNRWPKLDTKPADYFEEDSDGKFYAFANADCAFPPVAIIRANSFETAYEAFCNEFEAWLKIDGPDLKDYNVELNEPTCSFNSRGTPIDTEAVTGFPVTLVSVEC